MLSYRHAFHAGNYADVLKHLIQIEILSHLIKKEKPFTYIDTHAGAGLYALRSEQAEKTAEYKKGIGRLYDLGWEELEEYTAIVKACNEHKQLEFYPGSPKISQYFLREKDKAWLFDLHPTDYQLLEKCFSTDKRFIVKSEDGFDALNRLLPPVSKRGFVLIDPPYEIKNDYDRVVEVVKKAYRKFSTGTYAIWYPVVDRGRINRLEKKFIESGIRNISLFELGEIEDCSGLGMTSAGMIVINSPWRLFQTMEELLPKLANILGEDGKQVFRCQQLVGE